MFYNDVSSKVSHLSGIYKHTFEVSQTLCQDATAYLCYLGSEVKKCF